ncbi:MAG: hypothetical protein RBS17_11760 [Coriobacteriia bacterium]|nr:hypothetical protein [Coriobacteriia bacterium]
MIGGASGGPGSAYERITVQPTIIVPTFWTRRRSRGADRKTSPFDHPTIVGQSGPFAECMRSLERLPGLGKVVIIVAAADEGTANAAEDDIRELLDDMPGIDSFVVGPAVMGSLHRRLEQLEFADVMGGANLTSYGGARNVGLVAAAILGSESIVFVDDDEVVTDPEFLTRAMEGLGDVDDKGRPVLAKTGYYLSEQGSCATAGPEPWTDTFWRQNEFFDRAITAVGKPPRIKPTTLAFGGCMALHRDVYMNVPFDPWATRGEDVDYVIDARMHGADMYLDSAWSIVHCPPASSSRAMLFRHDVYRFIYTHRKLEFAKSQVDLRQVTAESLMPYPGHFVDASIGWRSRVTALLRALGSKERGAYLEIATKVVPEAQEYARENCERYFTFQRRWPMLMDRLWEDIALKSLFSGERRVDRGALTGRFPIIRVD